MKNAFILRGYKGHQNAPWAWDKIMFVEPITIDGSGDFTLDLSNKLNDSAEINYYAFKSGTLANGTLSGDTAVGNDQNGLCIIIANQHDLKAQ